MGSTDFKPLVSHRRVRLASKNRYAPPPQHFLDERAHVWQVRLVFKGGASVVPDNAVEFLPCGEESGGEGAAGEHEGDERGAGGVAAGADYDGVLKLAFQSDNWS